jgi:Tol biopolymer transport system component
VKGEGQLLGAALKRIAVLTASVATVAVFLGVVVSAQAGVGSARSAAALPPANGQIRDAAISANGRFVTFESTASNLVPGDRKHACTRPDAFTSCTPQVYVHDRLTGKTQLVSVSSAGERANGIANWADAISADGRFVVFESQATNLVPHSADSVSAVYLHDRLKGTTERVDVSTSGKTPCFACVDGDASISADGRFVAFDAGANLAPGPMNSDYDVYLRDRLTGTTERVSVSMTGTKPNGSDLSSYCDGMTADGRFVVFESSAPNLVPGDTNGHSDIFVRDMLTGTTERVSVSSSGTQGNRDSSYADISADGRLVVFQSNATNLVPGDTNKSSDVFVHDRLTGKTERVSVSSSGKQANGDSKDAYVSADGRFVTFDSNATNLVPGDTNKSWDVFVHDLLTGKTQRVSVGPGGKQAKGDTWSNGISADGNFVAFDSRATNLVPGDTNGQGDLYLRDRLKKKTVLMSPGLPGSLWAGNLQLRPWPARIGKTFSVTMPIHAGHAPVTRARFSCEATLPVRKLIPTVRRLSHSSVTCVWQIPAGITNPGLLAGSVTAKTPNGAVSRTFSAFIVH